MDGNQQHPPVPPTPDQQAANEAADRQARIDYLRSISKPPENEKRSLPTRTKVLLTILLILVLIAGAILVFSQTRKNHPFTNTYGKQGAATSGQAQDMTINQPNKQFHSDKLNLSFKYPENWKTSEKDNVVTSVSAPVQLKDASGAKVTGQVVYSIHPKGQNLAAFDAGNATAVLDSKKIAYTKPSDVQRGETFISFAQFANTTTKGALDAVYVTGDFAYQKGQAIPKSDVAKLDPVITLTFNKCGDSTCSQVQPTAIQASMWNDKAFADPLQAILSSLTVN